MLKKSLVTVVSTALLATAAVGCGSGDDKKTGTSASPSAAPASASPSNGPKPQLKQLMQFDRYDPNKDPVATFLKEKTGYDVVYEQLPAENGDEKLNLLMANKEPYDIMKLSSAQFAKLVSSGALEPLDDLLNKYGKNLKASISQESWDAVKVDGKIYAIPETGSGVTVSQSLVVRQDWMDELGLKIPTTADELYNVLKTIKDKKKIIPLTGGKAPVLPDIASTFGVTTTWKDSGGKLIHAVEDPGMKDYLTFMLKLYKEGLIDTEWPVNTADKAMQKMTSGQAAMFSLSWWIAPNLVNPFKKNFPNVALTTIPNLKNKEGKAQVLGTGTAVGWFISVPKFAKNKEEAIKYMDMKLQPDIFKELAIGKEGVHHTFKDGKYFPILPIFNDERNNGSAYLTGVDEKNYPTYWQARSRKDENVAAYFDKFQENAKGIIVLDPLAKAPQLEGISKNVQKLNKLQEDTFTKFITGAEPIENYDKFLQQWKSSGGDEMIKAANDWYKTAAKK
ncbi:extracellular solute-binding protein [Paenibacillus sp. MBLB4367]|uniref:extracellular solute-binding protein n=1 Tax=Paenibacillus sp. MBLB4367 TaxID=3384767 RepID=UPI003908356F